MVELKFNVSDVDYDSVLQALAGHLAGPALMAARALPDSAKEELVVRYINTNAALQSKGIHARISGAQAVRL